MALSKNAIKYIRSLQQKKFRQKYNIFVLEGDKIAREILRQSNLDIEAIYALDEWITNNSLLLQSHQQSVHAIEPTELKKISSLTTPNQVLVIAKKPEIELEASLVANDLTLYLDAIQDPGNMGTILRIADWFGVPYVFCSTHCVEVYSPKVVQASMGALLRVRVLEMELRALRERFPGLPVFGAVLEGENIFKTKFSQSGILAIGNESRGISPETEALLTRRIAIPKAQAGGAESLNAAIATGIIVAAWKNLS